MQKHYYNFNENCNVKNLISRTVFSYAGLSGPLQSIRKRNKKIREFFLFLIYLHTALALDVKKMPVRYSFSGSDFQCGAVKRE